ncbi:hypothetical protein C6W25_18790 [Bacillus halotolerans]|nr:hypothetical protein CJU60_04330 [Bacillus sp. 7705b]PRS17388.1 hypothetical protein C6W25_18790 [Bacillus halotolerans]
MNLKFYRVLRRNEIFLKRIIRIFEKLTVKKSNNQYLLQEFKFSEKTLKKLIGFYNIKSS